MDGPYFPPLLLEKALSVPQEHFFCVAETGRGVITGSRRLRTRRNDARKGAGFSYPTSPYHQIFVFFLVFLLFGESDESFVYILVVKISGWHHHKEKRKERNVYWREGNCSIICHERGTSKARLIKTAAKRTQY